jgi:hypothetical protein
LACARIAGNSSVFHRVTAAGSACQARHNGRCGDNPRVRSSRPTLTADSATPNSRRINWRTKSRVHNAKSNCSCRGSAPVTSAYSWRICSPDSFRGRPGTGFARSAPLPPSRAFASQPYTVLRCIPSTAATSSGCWPAATAATARNRICSSVA